MRRSFSFLVFCFLTALALLTTAGCANHDDAPAATVSRPPVPAASSPGTPPAAASAAAPGDQAARYQALMQQNPNHPANARN